MLYLGAIEAQSRETPCWELEGRRCTSLPALDEGPPPPFGFTCGSLVSLCSCSPPITSLSSLFCFSLTLLIPSLFSKFAQTLCHLSGSSLGPCCLHRYFVWLNMELSLEFLVSKLYSCIICCWYHNKMYSTMFPPPMIACLVLIVKSYLFYIVWGDVYY